MADLRGLRALVTGGSRGIGAGVALALAAEGVHVAVLSRTLVASEAIAKKCRKKKTLAIALAADVTDLDALGEEVARAARELGGLDIIVTSAGVAWLGPVASAPEGAWRRMVDVNLSGTMNTARYALPYLRQSRDPMMIFIGSVSSRMTYAGGAGYTASKHGLLGFAGALYEELRANRIKVSTICPGTVDTDMTSASGARYEASELLAVEDVVESVLYVARSSPRACPTEIVLRCHHATYV